jgi:thiamine biosynthesis lipoprotein
VEPLRYAFRAMGAPCQIALHGSAHADRIARAAIDETLRLEARYSRYRDDSVAAAINRSAGDPEGVVVDDETASLLDYADTAYRESGGLFDVTSGVLRRAWDFRTGRLPTEATIEPLLERVGWHRVDWDGRRLVLPLAGMEIDFGGYVKEYAADRVAALCRELGARHGLVDLGGDIALIGPQADGSPWRVGIRHPRLPGVALAWIPLREGAIATSGDYERFMVVDGRRYAHILDPRTGWPVEGLVTASVVAPHCIVAGTSTTIAMLQPGDRGRAWLAELGLPHLCVDGGHRVHGTLVAGATTAGSGRSVAGELVHG